MKAQYGLEVTVLHDPDQLSMAYGTNDQATLVGADGKITWKQKYASLSTVKKEIDKQIP